jgi:alkanesulfonate monooxygenase SsuD/methylene tetrahydromethanopterin reductase-like flavin-dependent oxidoreductase (luciferase family)
MPVRIGYLLPTREQVMEGRPEAAPLLALAERAEGLGYDSIWVGDSITARPRHEPLTLLSAVAARTKTPELGTAVLLPALRNPVVLAHGIATLDQISEGRFILGVGIASDVPNIRAEFVACGVPFEKRVGRMLEGLRLCQELWRGRPVTWNGRWVMENVTLGPVPHRPGGPPIWIGGGGPTAFREAARFDAWFPTGPSVEFFTEHFPRIRAAARAAGRPAEAVSGAAYVTLALDPDKGKAERRLHQFLETYYAAPAAAMMARQATYAGPIEGCVEWLRRWIDAGASHLALRFAGGDQLAQVDETATKLLPRLR